MRKIISACLLFFIAHCAFAANDNASQINPISGSSIFTSQMTKFGDPSDNIDRISMNNDCIIIFTKFYNLPIRENDYTCIIYDGSGKIVENITSTMNVQSHTWQTWTKHEFNQNFDSPGSWKFDLYVNNAKIVEKTIKVTPFVIDEAHAETNRKNYMGLGITTISHSDQYYGGSYLYAMYGRRIATDTLISLQYSYAAAPFFGEDAFITTRLAYYLGISRKENFYTGLSAVYQNNISGKDSGSIGLELSPFNNGLVDDTISIAILPIECMYNLDDKSWNFSFEIFRLYIRF